VVVEEQVEEELLAADEDRLLAAVNAKPVPSSSSGFWMSSISAYSLDTFINIVLQTNNHGVRETQPA
jgi:hypothetical protein